MILLPVDAFQELKEQGQRSKLTETSEMSGMLSLEK